MALRIVFMGTPEFALPSMTRLFQSGHELVAVVTAPDKPAGRGQRLRLSRVKELALKLKIPVWQPVDLVEPAFLKALHILEADLYVVVAFRILPPEVFTLPRIGTVNLHASLLPKYRGAAPINWAIINGESETGATTFFIDEHVDTGQWLLQCKVPIPAEMSAGELHDLLATAGADLLLQTVTGLADGTLKPRRQEGEVTRAPKLTKEMGRIFWGKPAREIHNLVRGLSPYPAAWTLWHGLSMKVLQTRFHPEAHQAKPGSVLICNEKDGVHIATGAGTLELLKVQLQGGKTMMISQFLRGHAITPGDTFDENDILQR